MKQDHHKSYDCLEYISSKIKGCVMRRLQRHLPPALRWCYRIFFFKAPLPLPFSAFFFVRLECRARTTLVAHVLNIMKYSDIKYSWYPYTLDDPLEELHNLLNGRLPDNFQFEKHNDSNLSRIQMIVKTSKAIGEIHCFSFLPFLDFSIEINNWRNKSSGKSMIVRF